MQKRRRMWGWVFVAPQFIGLLIFALIPLVMSFVISFHDWDGIADTMKFVGVKNYVHQVMDSDFQKALVNTVIYSIMYIPLNIVLALILALAVDQRENSVPAVLFYAGGNRFCVRRCYLDLDSERRFRPSEFCSGSFWNQRTEMADGYAYGLALHRDRFCVVECWL